MMVTLNGELLFNDRGSELAAKNFDIRDGLQKFLTSYFLLHANVSNIAVLYLC